VTIGGRYLGRSSTRQHVSRFDIQHERSIRLADRQLTGKTNIKTKNTAKLKLNNNWKTKTKTKAKK